MARNTFNLLVIWYVEIIKTICTPGSTYQYSNLSKPVREVTEAEKSPKKLFDWTESWEDLELDKNNDDAYKWELVNDKFIEHEVQEE